MNFLQKHYTRVVKREVLNKFIYKNVQNLPKLNKIVISFERVSKNDFEYLSILLLAFELITLRSGDFTISKKSNIRINIKRGSPAGCKIILKKKHMYNFFFKIIIEILPKLKKVKNLNFSNTQKPKGRREH